MWAQAGIAAGLALGVYAAVSAGTFALTQRLDPSLATLERNRYGVAGLATIAGLALAATKSPLMGAGIAAGGLVVLAGSKLAIAVGGLIDPKPKSQIGEVYGNVGGYQAMAGYQPMAGYLPMGQVYGDMGQVFGDMGAYVPPAPWSGNPF